MKRLLKAALLLMMMLMGLGCVSVFASSGSDGIFDFYVGMPPAGTSKYDVNGDGKKDTVSFAWNEVEMTQTLDVNGKTIKQWKLKGDGDYTWVTIVTVGKKSFLEIEVDNWKTRSLECGLYTIKNDKLKCVLNYADLINSKLLLNSNNKFADTGTECTFLEASKVKGNTIYLDGTFATKALGQVNFEDLKLNYKNGKFKLGTSAAKAVSTPRDENGQFVSYFSAGKKIKTYKKAGSSAKAVTIGKGKQFKITKMKVVKKNLYLRARTKDGKLGWIKAGKAQLVTSRTPYAEE